MTTMNSGPDATPGLDPNANPLIGGQPPKPKQQKVGFLLGIGILFLPFIFVWWLLKPGYSRLARGIGFGWLLVFLLIAFGSSGKDKAKPGAPAVTTSSSPAPAAPAAATAPAVSEPAAPKSKWAYSEDVDKMRGEKTRYASLDSENALKFGFPYDGGKVGLALRQRPQDGLNVILTVKGQFACSSYSNDSVSVKFDDKPIQKFRCAEPAAGGSGTLFIKNEKHFVEQLKSAKTMTIEAQFFETGARQMQFDVAGLDWK